MKSATPVLSGARVAGEESLWAAPLTVWAALMVLLALTVLAAAAPLGPFKTATSLAIAGVKVVLIAVVFMKLNRATNLVRLASLAGLIWASFLFILAGVDYVARG